VDEQKDLPIGIACAIEIGCKHKICPLSGEAGKIMIAARANLLSLTAKDLMTTEVVNVHPEMSVKDAALLLVKNGISGAPRGG
jgi:predicted transcriptional regulator